MDGVGDRMWDVVRGMLMGEGGLIDKGDVEGEQRMETGSWQHSWRSDTEYKHFPEYDLDIYQGDQGLERAFSGLEELVNY